MKEILSRLNSPLPSFFKKLRNIAIVVVTLATTVLYIPMPENVYNWAHIIIAVGASLGITSQLTSVNHGKSK